jgi:hypothetical protein
MAGNSDRNVAPTSQNHEIPRMVSAEKRCENAFDTMRQLSPATFQLTMSEGDGAGADGIPRLAA